MRATAFEFRFRLLILFVLLALGFWSPGLTTPSLWMLLAGWLSHQHWLGIQTASLAVGYTGALLTLGAAALRTWAAAYVGSNIVSSGQIHARTTVAAGPFRFMRHPIYVGSEFHLLALALLMPVYGAIFVAISASIFFYRLLLAEEFALAAKEEYRAYAARVPRIFPAMRPQIPPAAQAPHWGQAFLGEIYCWGAAISFAAFVPQFNSIRILQGVGVSFGLWLILKAVSPWSATPGASRLDSET